MYSLNRFLDFRGNKILGESALEEYLEDFYGRFIHTAKHTLELQNEAASVAVISQDGPIGILSIPQHPALHL